MNRALWYGTVAILIVTSGGILLSAQRGLAQAGAASALAPADIAALKNTTQLPDALDKRVVLADKLTALNFRGMSDAKIHEYHYQFIAPQFFPGPRRFLPFPVKKLTAVCTADTIYSQGAFPATINQSFSNADGAGCIGTYLPGGQVDATTNPFFQSLGTNGRSCATCHQPPSGMSVSVSNINARLKATTGTDPIFASIDGANCPNNVPAYTGSGTAFKAAHSLLLQRGLFRVFEPVPANAQFTVSAVDPYGCNTTAPWNQDTVNGQNVQMVSVYRRPRISAGMNFVTSFQSPVPSGVSLMWDTRETSLLQQALDATHGHAQGGNPPSAAQAAAMVQFETQLYSAQANGPFGMKLGAPAAKGGPKALSLIAFPLPAAAAPAITFDEYNAWTGTASAAIAARRASITRGQKLFDTRQFAISNVAGLNNVPGLTNPFQGTCSGCHSQPHAGNDQIGSAAVLDIGIDGASVANGGNAPSTDLPVFTVTCSAGNSSAFNGSTVVTNDLGLALQTGKCADIGRYSIPQLRALAARAQYFHDGSAKTLWNVVAFYNRRFKIKLTYREQQDLVNFLSSL